MTAREIAGGFTLLEGPRWRSDGLYVSDFFSESVLRFPSPERDSGHELVCTVPGRPSGLGFDPAGRLLIVSMDEHRLYRLDRGELTVVAEFAGLMSGPANDMHVDAEGRAYIGGFGTSEADSDLLEATRIVGVSPDGDAYAAASGLVFPNGIVPTADGTALLIAETYRGRVTRYPVLDDGRLGRPEVALDRSEGIAVTRVSEGDARMPWLPDGLTIDVEGGLWVADAKGHGITRFSEDGRQTDFISSGDLSVYAGALGGVDGRTLFLCCAPAVGTFDPTVVRASALLAARVAIPGAAS